MDNKEGKTYRLDTFHSINNPRCNLHPACCASNFPTRSEGQARNRPKFPSPSTAISSRDDHESLRGGRGPKGHARSQHENERLEGEENGKYRRGVTRRGQPAIVVVEAHRACLFRAFRETRGCYSHAVVHWLAAVSGKIRDDGVRTRTRESMRACVRASEPDTVGARQGVPYVFRATRRNGRGVFTAALTVAVFRASENTFLRSYNRTVK